MATAAAQTLQSESAFVCDQSCCQSLHDAGGGEDARAPPRGGEPHQPLPAAATPSLERHSPARGGSQQTGEGIPAAGSGRRAPKAAHGVAAAAVQSRGARERQPIAGGPLPWLRGEARSHAQRRAAAARGHGRAKLWGNPFKNREADWEAECKLRGRQGGGAQLSLVTRVCKVPRCTGRWQESIYLKRGAYLIRMSSTSATY